MAANNPVHGQSIIKVVESALGGKKLIATDCIAHVFDCRSEVRRQLIIAGAKDAIGFLMSS